MADLAWRSESRAQAPMFLKSLTGAVSHYSGAIRLRTKSFRRSILQADVDPVAVVLGCKVQAGVFNVSPNGSSQEAMSEVGRRYSRLT